MFNLRRLPITSLLVLAASSFAGSTASAADPAPSGKAAASKNPVVEIKTTLGTIKAELFADKAPVSTKNFLEYVDAKYYDGTIFHRVIDKFMIQGGGFDEKMTKKTTRDPIINEAGNGLGNEPGTLAMARTNDPNSATSQFYINTVNNVALNHRDGSAGGIGYAVFGKVISGMEVVMKISAVETGVAGGMRDVPKTPVVIQSIRRAK